MTDIPVRFEYLTGIKGDLFRNPRLVGSWDGAGHFTSQWTERPMQTVPGEDGCPSFTCTVSFADAGVNTRFYWGVRVDGPAGAGLWAIPTEVQDAVSQDRVRSFTLLAPGNTESSPQQERYFFTHCRRLGAQKLFGPNPAPALRFAVWAPYAQAVDVVFGRWNGGYISDTGYGMDPARPPISLRKATRSLRQDDPDWDGVWETDLATAPALANFDANDHAPYMFRITRDDGSVVYRTDLHSRCQVGSGSVNPKGVAYSGRYVDLDGKVSCSAVVDADTVTSRFKPAEWPADKENGLFIPADRFWQREFNAKRPVPSRIEDLVIYELHVASLGYGRNEPGTFQDAIDLLDSHLVPLGVNAVELLPVAEFGGKDEWGYGDTHQFALEFRSGGRDQLKHFVRECHRRGIAVILDVVYNHFSSDAVRAEWAYDAASDDRNIYYWYEGRTGDWPTSDGGYLDNGSTGYTPRFWEETVRKLFISSAAALVSEFHVDGFRVDLTQAIHGDNRAHADGRVVDAANKFGTKFLREWTRTLKLIRPNVFLIAEEHEDRVAITRPTDTGGMGFDATWFVDFYHNLVGTPREGDNWARLVALAGFGGDGPLRLDWFAGALDWSRNSTIVYHISHDEAGNSGSGDPDPDKRSHRTIVTAVHSAPLLGLTRSYAEARCRVAAGLAMLAPATPMFLMGEEVGASKDYRYNDFLANREDLQALRVGEGKHLFQFYKDMIAFRHHHPALRSRDAGILYISVENRVLALHRWSAAEELLVFASLNNQPFGSGYRMQNLPIPDHTWQEIFNSDAAVYGGGNVGNARRSITSAHGMIEPVIPANGFVVFRKL
jgi:1,4-alpha-glucan branching enzyme